jgi:hypothetical protein
MSISDPQLRSLYARLEEVLGSEHADTLMTHLPAPHELATKADLHEAIAPVRSDLALLTVRFDGLDDRFDRLEDRFEGLHALMHAQFRNYSVVAASFMTGMTAVFGVMLAAFG